MIRLIIFLFFIFTINAFSQDTIPVAKAKNYVNNLVCVTGKVVSVKKAGENQKVNYLNLDIKYPDNIFTIILTNDYLAQNKLNLDDFKDKTIYVYGKVTTYINDPKQIPQIFNPRRIDVKK